MRVAAVLGTRPEAIKLAPVVAALRRASDVECAVISTGQHREMLDQMLELFDLRTDVDLGVMQPGQQLPELTADLVRGLGGTLAALEPDWSIVQGDTTTAFAGALASFYAGIPVAHVEAGLRSGCDRTPFPEEANRQLVARLATLHFSPTVRAAGNLVSEGIARDRVRITGNTVIDALHWAVDRARHLASPFVHGRRRRILLTVHRRENHGAAIRRICDAVRRLSWRGDVEFVFPVHRSPAVRGVVAHELSYVDGVRLGEPLDYLSLVRALGACDLVVTDSGGLQEEGPALGKPVLVLRDATERPEAVDAGVARLVGTDADAIVSAASELLDDPAAYAAMAHVENPFGDGQASLRIVNALREWNGGARASA